MSRTSIPARRQTINSETGRVEDDRIARFDVAAPPPGTCAECGCPHEADEPHDALSLHYQYSFYGREGRWPDWNDAMAHCDEQTRRAWAEALEEAGVDLPDAAPR